MKMKDIKQSGVKLSLGIPCGKKAGQARKYTVFAILILSIVFSSLSAGAAQGNKISDNEIYITYSSIDDMVKENNLQLKLSNLTLYRLKRDLNSSEDDLEEARKHLLNTMHFLTQVSRDMDRVIVMDPPGMPSDSEGIGNEDLKEIYKNQTELYKNLVSVANATKVSLEIAQNNIYSQIQNLGAGTEGAEDQIELTELNIKQAENTLINSARNLFIVYHQMNINLRQLENSQRMMEEQLDSMKARFEQGLIKQDMIMDLETSLLELKASQRSLINQREVILLQVKNILGYTYKDNVYLGQLPLVDPKFIDNIDFEKDVEEALSNAMSLKIKKKELDNQSIWGLRRDYELQIREDEVYIAFLKQYMSLLEKYSTLIVSESKLENVKYKLKSAEENFRKGLISQNELDSLKNEVKAKELEVQSNSLALLCEIENYKAMKAGNL